MSLDLIETNSVLCGESRMEQPRLSEGPQEEECAEVRQCKSVCSIPIEDKKKKKRGRFFFNVGSSNTSGEKSEKRNVERSKTLCLKMFKKSFNVPD